MQDKGAAGHSIHWLVQQSCGNKAAGISGRVSMEAPSTMGCLLLMCTDKHHGTWSWPGSLNDPIKPSLLGLLSLCSRCSLKITAALVGLALPKGTDEVWSQEALPHAGSLLCTSSATWQKGTDFPGRASRSHNLPAFKKKKGGWRFGNSPQRVLTDQSPLHGSLTFQGIFHRLIFRFLCASGL